MVGTSILGSSNWVEKILHQLKTIGKYEALGSNGMFTINQLVQDFAGPSTVSSFFWTNQCTYNILYPLVI